MANVLTVNPMKIDTAGATALLSSKLYPQSIRWVGATTAGHQAIVQDKDGNVMWKSVASGSNYVEGEQLDLAKPWDGLLVPTLGSGELFITLRHDPPSS